MQKNKKYKHGEAFCLMKYRCVTCGNEEILWNSRDGVTPFTIGCPKCEERGIKASLKDGIMQHVDWNEDECRPDYLPFPKQRVFVDSTLGIDEVHCRARILRQWTKGPYPMRDRWSTPMEALKDLADFSEGEPYIITI